MNKRVRVEKSAYIARARNSARSRNKNNPNYKNTQEASKKNIKIDDKQVKIVRKSASSRTEPTTRRFGLARIAVNLLLSVSWTDSSV